MRSFFRIGVKGSDYLRWGSSIKYRYREVKVQMTQCECYRLSILKTMPLTPKVTQLKHENLNLFLLRSIAIPELRPSQQLKQRKMRLPHVEYPALLLVDERTINDDALKFVQFESS